jgi:hypothetical protein
LVSGLQMALQSDSICITKEPAPVFARVIKHTVRSSLHVTVNRIAYIIEYSNNIADYKSINITP